MENLEFYRVSCANNTFLVCSFLQTPTALSVSQRQTLARKYCSGFFGFQNDGLIFLEGAPGLDFKWDFYNADGSSAEMCGNAARGVALVFQKLAPAPSARQRFQTGAGEISTEILSADQVKVTMPTIQSEKNLLLSTTQGEVSCFFVNTGVPHLVIEQKPQLLLAKELRKHSQVGAAGANVTFVESGEPLKAVTFERGVEGFTQACGTGGVAAARWSYKKAPQNNPVQVQMPGGMLIVEFFGSQMNQVYLTGQARIDFKVIIPKSDLGV